MLKRGFYVFIAALVLAAFAAIPARAQFGAIEGDVKDADGKPMIGAQIVLDRTDIKGQYKVKSDKKGHYYHGGLPLGTFNISLMQGEQKLDFVQNVRVRLGDPQVVNFDLKLVKDRALAAQAGVKMQQAPGEAAPQLTKEQRAKIDEQLKQREAARQKQEKLGKSFNAGMEALKAKNFDEAAADFQQAADADPTQHVVFANLGEAYAGSAKAKKGEEATATWAKAIDSYQKAIALKADDASYHNNYALALIASGKTQEGMDELQKAAQLDPTNAGQYYFNLGAVLTNSGKGKEASQAFKKATELQPSYAEAWYQLGVSLLSEAKLDEKTGKMVPAPGTVEALQKYMEVAPTGPHVAEAKSMIDTLGSTVQTEIKAQKGAKKKP